MESNYMLTTIWRRQLRNYKYLDSICFSENQTKQIITLKIKLSNTLPWNT